MYASPAGAQILTATMLRVQVQDMLTKAQSRYEEGDRYQALKLWEQALKQVSVCVSLVGQY